MYIAEDGKSSRTFILSAGVPNVRVDAANVDAADYMSEPNMWVSNVT